MLENGPLTGLKVVEFAHMVMGPTVGLMLADMGAEVIKVEPIGGDKTRKLKGPSLHRIPGAVEGQQCAAVEAAFEGE